jgi:hypothetical protein
VPGGLERLRDAVGEALAVWTAESTHSGEVLDALLRLAKRLPGPNHVAALRRLFFEGFLEEQPRNELLALQALESALALLGLNDGESLLHDLRSSPSWQPAFAATWLEGMTRAGKLDWYAGLRELKGDLSEVAPTGEELHPLLCRLLYREGDAAEVVKRFEGFDPNDEWMVKALFIGENPPIRLVARRDFFNKNAPILLLSIGEDLQSYVDPRHPSAEALYGIYQTYFSSTAGSLSTPRAKTRKRAPAASARTSLQGLRDDLLESLKSVSLAPAGGR